MKILFFISILVLFGIFFTPISGDESETIPDWVKNTIVWWSEGRVSDSEFITSLEYLANNNIINVKSQSQTDEIFIEKYQEWAKKEIEKYKDYSQKLKEENKKLISEIRNLQKENQQIDYLEDRLASYETTVDDYDEYLESWFQEQESKPQTKIHDQEIQWRVVDSKGNVYNWSMPVENYEAYVIADRFSDLLYFKDKQGETFKVWDHTKYVGTSFSKIIDQVYDNSNDDNDFVYEIWFITSQLTTYSYDIGDYPRYALETLSRGGGDCEDTTILILDMLKSSKHTKDWEFQMLYFDTDNLENPNSINHVAPVIRINDENLLVIESTAKTPEEMNSWSGKSIFGWWEDV